MSILTFCSSLERDLPLKIKPKIGNLDKKGTLDFRFFITNLPTPKPHQSPTQSMFKA